MIKHHYHHEPISLWELNSTKKQITQQGRNNLRIDESLQIVAAQKEMEVITRKKKKSVRQNEAKRERRISMAKRENRHKNDKLKEPKIQDGDPIEVEPYEDNESIIRKKYVGTWDLEGD